MYHIKNDKRSIYSTEELYKALLNILKKHQLNEIKVISLVEEAQIGRSTFYRNFDEIKDILIWKCDLFFDELLLFILNNISLKNEKEVIDFIFSYWFNKIDFLEILIKNKMLDIIYSSFSKYSSKLEQLIMKNPNVKTLDYKYFLTIRFSVFIGVINIWINTGKKESILELSSIINESLS